MTTDGPTEAGPTYDGRGGRLQPGLVERGDPSIQIFYRLLKHRLMRGRACGLQIRKRARPRQLQRHALRRPPHAVGGADRRRMTGIGCRFLLRLHGFAFPSSRHESSLHPRRRWRARAAIEGSTRCYEWAAARSAGATAIRSACAETCWLTIPSARDTASASPARYTSFASTRSFWLAGTESGLS